MPERLRGRFPRWTVELGVGLAVPLFVVLCRVALIPVAGDRAPYSFVFAGVVVASVLAGWRSGLLALIVGQALTWFMVVRPHWLEISPAHALYGGLVVATLAQLMILAVIALYQREMDKDSLSKERQMHLLSDALHEMDHRTKNNYQTVLALVQLQAQRSKDPAVKLALQQVGDRINAVTRATEQLALRSESLGTIRLRDHLCELCSQVERGLSRDGVKVECDVDNVNASTEKTIYLSIIVNELVTNALKHAFQDGSDGKIRVHSQVNGRSVAIVVEDDGCGLDASRSNGRTGLGSKLVERFARQLGAKHEVTSSGSGTVHRIVMASLE